jgi:hypothetical protein
MPIKQTGWETPATSTTREGPSGGRFRSARFADPAIRHRIGAEADALRSSDAQALLIVRWLNDPL